MMIKHCATLSLRSARNLICMALLSLCSAMAAAAIDDLTIQCQETAPGSQVYDLQTCTVMQGTLTSTQLLELSVDVLTLLGKNPGIDYIDPNSSCSIVNGVASCKVGLEQLLMECTVTTDPFTGKRSGSCSMSTTPPASEVPVAFFSVSCDETNGACNIHSDSSALAAQVKGQLPPGNTNLGQIADSLLSCVSRNSFDVFQHVCDQVIEILQQPGGAGQVAAFIQSIQPLNPDAPADTTTFTIKQALANLGQRLSHIRSGAVAATQQYHNPVYRDGQHWYEVGDLLADSNAVASDTQKIDASTSLSEYGQLGIFINGTAIKTNQSGDLMESGSKTGSTILTMGVDYRFTDQLVAGVAYNLGQSTTDFSQHKGRLDTDTQLFTLYGTYYKSSWFFDGSLGIGGDNYEQQRNYVCTLACGTAPSGLYLANYHSKQTTLSVSSGYDWAYRSFNIVPYAQLTLGKVTIDGYYERRKYPPFAVLTVEMDEQDKDIGTLNLGTNFQYIVNTGKGVFIPLISIQLISDFEDETQFVTGRFIANKSSGSDFTLETSEVDAFYLIIGTGLSFQLKNGNAGFINIQKTAGYENIDQTRLTAGWRWEI